MEFRPELQIVFFTAYLVAVRIHLSLDHPRSTTPRVFVPYEYTDRYSFPLPPFLRTNVLLMLIGNRSQVL